MGSEDFIDLAAFGASEDGNENNGLNNTNSEQSEAGSQPGPSQVIDDIPISENNGLHNANSEQNEAGAQHGTSQVIDGIPNGENLQHFENACFNEDDQHSEDMVLDEDVLQDQSNVQKNVEFATSVTVAEKTFEIKSGQDSENMIPFTLNEGGVNGDPRDRSSISGFKRARTTSTQQQPYVHVAYNFLTRESKRKLEELLRQWSEWHTRYVSPSIDPPTDALENGEETYFPAICLGLQRSSTVSFRIDNVARPEESKESVSVEGDSVPLYDRGYALGLTSLDGVANRERVIERLDSSRCFNCGSYNHSLKECPKPRDHAAVSNARREHNSKWNQAGGAGGSRLPTRYYQSSPGGKFEGLRAGVLGAETRQCLGIGELDPPPWLHRMREIGYPPGYLEREDNSSGITIYADEETREEHEDGEILEFGELEPPPKKMVVEFPGINAPIPENADHRRWAVSPAISNHSQFRSSRSSESSKGHYREQKRPRDYSDEGPPGVDYGQWYSGYDTNYQMESQSPRGNNPIGRSPCLGRSLSERGWRSPLVHEGSPGRSPHSPFPYSSSCMAKYSPQNYGPPNFDNFTYDGYRGSSSESASSRKDRQDYHRK